MKCFLHIGTEKTATTTLQIFLSKNREKLYELGYFYPKSVGEIDHRKLSVIAYNLNRRDEFTRKHYIYTDNELAKYQKKTIYGLNEELRNINTKKVIFSSEHIQSRLTTITEIERLKKLLNNLGFVDITVIVYLRNPSDIAGSLYSTAVKAGSTASMPPPPTDPYFNNICNHKNTLEKFSKVFGEDKVVPRIFHRKEFKKGSIIDDFLDILGIQDSSQFVVTKSENKSLSPLGIELLRRVNKRVPVFINNKPNKMRGDIVLYFERFFTGKYTVPRYLYNEYKKYFNESNEWVRKKYFPYKSSLFEEKINIKETKVMIPSIVLDIMAFIISKAWIYKRRKELSRS